MKARIEAIHADTLSRVRANSEKCAINAPDDGQ